MWALALTAFLLWRSVHTAHSAVLEKSGTEGNNTYLFCENVNKVVWEKGADRGRSVILTAEKGKAVIKHKPDHRYGVLGDLSLYIRNLSLSDSGIYYCNSTAVVYLTVTPGQRSNAETGKDSAGKGINTRAVMDIDPERKVSGSRKVKEDDDEHDDDDDEEQVAWTAAAAGGMSCVLVLLVALSVWRVFIKRKGSQKKQVHVYDSVNYVPAAPHTEFRAPLNPAHVYASVNDLPQRHDEQRESEAVYFLAQSPTPNTTATGDQKRGENEAVYSLATAPVFTAADQDRAEHLYATIQRPV